MMVLAQSMTAVAANIQASFVAQGGTAPYTYAVLGADHGGGAGGTINASTGVYRAPAAVQSDARLLYDVIEATDSLGAKARSRILVGHVFMLFCDIIQNQMGLP